MLHTQLEVLQQRQFAMVRRRGEAVVISPGPDFYEFVPALEEEAVFWVQAAAGAWGGPIDVYQN
jgi:hypothetical protein